MTAIGGCVSWDGEDPSQDCGLVLKGMSAFGDRLVRQATEEASFGLVAGELPGECTIAHDDRFLLIADSRIDRVEGEATESQTSSNAGRLLACWRRSGGEMFDRIEGDFALAIWDREKRQLFLARSALSSRFLSYRTAGRSASFATFPAAIAADGLNSAELAARVCGYAHFGSSATVYNGVEAVEPGTLVCLGPDRKQLTRFWQPESIEIIRRSDREAANELLDLLRQAVANRVRGSSDPVASHLSSGRDSSAVSLVAARLLAADDRHLTCFTAAPRTGWPERAEGYLLDESHSASGLAGSLPNAEHHIVRASAFGLASAMDEAHRVHHQPITNPVNMSWWDEIQHDAAAAGASVLLTATCGNYGLSAGGPPMLADLLGKDAMAWARKAVAIGRLSPAAWRNVLNLSFGPHVPAGAYRFVRRAVGRAGGQVDYPFLSGSVRERAEAIVRQRTADERPSSSYREMLYRTLERLDNADKMGLVRHGVDVRDPTADRQLISFTLSLTDEQLTSTWSSRTIYDLAFESDLPRSVVRPVGRGHQSSDWNQVIDPRELRDALDRYRANPLVAEMIDVRAMETALEQWPSGLAIDPATYRRYAEQLLLAFSLASFVWVQSA